MFWLSNLLVFLAASLLFQIELVASKALLPRFGGSYLVWSVSVVVFQGLLLAGYACARSLPLAGRWPVRLLPSALMLLPLAAFPLEYLTLARPGADLPFVPDIAWTLLRTVGPAFFVLSMVSILAQRLLVLSGSARSANPYVLYATSNLGSFAGLLSYPFAVEPLWDLPTQLIFWQWGYVACALLFMVTQIGSLRGVSDAPRPVEGGASATPPVSRPPGTPLSLRLRWLLLSASGSALFLAVTNVITFDLAAVPLLWILPLSLYLLGFVLTFREPGWYPQWLRERFPLAVALGLFLFLLLQQSYRLPVTVMLAVHLGLLFALSVISSGELYASRPARTAELGDFYLLIGLGGFLGGALVSWFMPLLSDTVLEYPLALLLLALAFAFGRERQRLRPGYVLVALGIGPLVAAWMLVLGRLQGPETSLAAGAVGLLVAMLFYLLKKRPGELALCLGVAISLTPLADHFQVNQHLVCTYRNYYGIYRVHDAGGKRILQHGTTLHGSQYLDPARQREALDYYHVSAPPGALLSSGLFDTTAVGLVGLGAGSLATYARPGERYVFYELDPDNEDVARRYFTFLSQSRGTIELVFGDARLTLARAPADAYGVLIVDAFNSDAIPIHLLTVEAFQEYLRCLRPDGLLLLHISNKFLNLAPIVAANARELGLTIRFLRFERKVPADAKSCLWVALTRSPDLAGVLETRLGWSAWLSEASRPVAAWTDRSANLLSALR